MERKIVSADELSSLQFQEFREKSKEGVKEGSPIDDILDINNSNSILSKYVQKKREEYNMLMENFDEDFEDKIINKQIGEEDEDVVIGGVGSYGNNTEEKQSKKIIKFVPPKETINSDNIIDDLL